MDRASAGGPPQRTEIMEDQRAPVTFGWWRYPNDRFTDHYHLETTYRLDRVVARLADHCGVGTLLPSEYYSQSTECQRELLRVRKHVLLPLAPPAARWIGQELIREVASSVIAPGRRGQGVRLRPRSPLRPEGAARLRTLSCRQDPLRRVGA